MNVFDSIMTIFGCFEMIRILVSVRIRSDRTLNDSYINVFKIYNWLTLNLNRNQRKSSHHLGSKPLEIELKKYDKKTAHEVCLF